MFRKFVWSAVVAVGCVAPFAAAPPLNAQSIYQPHRYHHRVLYRRCGAEPWVLYGRYEHLSAARHAAHHLSTRGFEVLVE